MAFVTPYSDPNGHGSIANAYTFRRNNGRVILEKKPVCKKDPTPLQEDNRIKFRNVQSIWRGLDQDEQNTISAVAEEHSFDGYRHLIKKGMTQPLHTGNFYSFLYISKIFILYNYEYDDFKMDVEVWADDNWLPGMLKIAWKHRDGTEAYVGYQVDHWRFKQKIIIWNQYTLPRGVQIILEYRSMDGNIELLEIRLPHLRPHPVLGVTFGVSDNGDVVNSMSLTDRFSLLS